MTPPRACVLLALLMACVALPTYADDQAAKRASVTSEAPVVSTFETAEQLLAMPPCRATLKGRTPCSADLITAEGTKVRLGSPKATAEVIRFLLTLQEGETYALPHAFISHQALQALDQKLTPIIQHHFPDAQFSRTNMQFEAKHGTMEFLVHGRSKTGEINAVAHKEEGPNYRGFHLRIQVLEERFSLAAAVPQEISHPYWMTFLDASPLPQKKSYYLVSFSYGSRLDPDFRQAIRAVLPSSLRTSR